MEGYDHGHEVRTLLLILSKELSKQENLTSSERNHPAVLNKRKKNILTASHSLRVIDFQQEMALFWLGFEIELLHFIFCTFYLCKNKEDKKPQVNVLHSIIKYFHLIRIKKVSLQWIMYLSTVTVVHVVRYFPPLVHIIMKN